MPHTQHLSKQNTELRGRGGGRKWTSKTCEKTGSVELDILSEMKCAVHSGKQTPWFALVSRLICIAGSVLDWRTSAKKIEVAVRYMNLSAIATNHRPPPGEEDRGDQKTKGGGRLGLTIIHAPDTRPELLLLEPGEGIGGLLAGVGPVPGAAAVVAVDEVADGVGRHLENVTVAGGAALLDVADLAADGDERVGEPVELLAALALGRLDHQRAADRPAHRRRVEAVVLQPLRDVDHLDPGRLQEGARVQDELVRAPPVLRAGVQDPVVRPQPRQQVVGVQQRDLGRVRQTVGSYAWVLVSPSVRQKVTR